jgi:hypothetical protein
MLEMNKQKAAGDQRLPGLAGELLYAVIDHNRDELRKKDIFPREIKNF